MKELIEIQRAMHVPKDKKGHKYDYRKVDDILKSFKENSSDNVFLNLSDDVVSVGANIYTKATATISNGDLSVSACAFAKEGPLPGQSDPQISGSCSTYARKKALEGLFALDDGEGDPDGMKGKKNPDLTKITKEHLDKLNKCIVALKTNGFVSQSEGLKKLFNNNTLDSDFEKLYDRACGYIGEKI